MVTKTEVLHNGQTKSAAREKIVNTFDTDLQSASESDNSSFYRQRMNYLLQKQYSQKKNWNVEEKIF